MSDPTNPTADGQLADPQGSNFNVKIEDTRNRKVQADAHSSITNAAGPIMRSAVASHGGRLSTPPTEESIVTVRGQSMKVSTAERMGWVVRNPDGTFSDATAENSPGPQDGGQDGTTEGADADTEADETNSLQVEPDTAEGLADLSQALESVGANPVAVASEIMTDPEKMPAAVLELARSRGMDEGQAFEHVQNLTRSVVESVEDFVLSNSTLEAEELEALWDHARANNSPAQFNRNILAMLFEPKPNPTPLLGMIAAYQRRSR